MVYAIPTYELRSTPAFGRRRRLPPAAAAMLVFKVVHCLIMPVLAMHLISNSTCLRGAIQGHYGSLVFLIYRNAYVLYSLYDIMCLLGMDTVCICICQLQFVCFSPECYVFYYTDNFPGMIKQKALLLLT